MWLEEEPALEVQVENEAERGLLGVTILKEDTCSKKYPSCNSTKTESANNESSIPRVFLYFTEKSENENKQYLRNKIFSMNGTDTITVLLILN
ncbi:MAG TPA: hypothetical protein VJ799_07275 [Nitrososphaeraceae archaeon]|nr:hypothetical protein [Nitrososphaeraceae archaeon]